ncbi:tRNA (guanine-N(1)-)-methyltransferase [Streptomyces californicus]
MSTTPPVLAAELAQAWADIQRYHPELPDLAAPESLIGESSSACGAELSFERLLHEAVHGIAAARGVRDTSRAGRYHNRRFLAIAEELGLDHAEEPHPSSGFSLVTLNPEAKRRYRPDHRTAGARTRRPVATAADAEALPEGPPLGTVFLLDAARGKARARGVLDVHVHDLREWTYDRHNTVDDTPYGGGPGMVMKTEPWGDALDEALADGYEAGAHSPVLVVPTPGGRPFTQELAVELSAAPWLVFTPARYEGIDRRVIDEYATRTRVVEVSIGDYVLAGGEAAVLVVTEAVARLLPGVLGNAESHRDDSFAPGAMANLLEGPVYTKPPEWRGRSIPDVLLSGHHGKIARWRRDQAFARTALNRPDLIERCEASAFDKKDREILSILGFAPEPGGRFWRRPTAVEE